MTLCKLCTERLLLVLPVAAVTMGTTTSCEVLTKAQGAMLRGGDACAERLLHSEHTCVRAHTNTRTLLGVKTWLKYRVSDSEGWGGVRKSAFHKGPG